MTNCSGPARDHPRLREKTATRRISTSMRATVVLPWCVCAATLFSTAVPAGRPLIPAVRPLASPSTSPTASPTRSPTSACVPWEVHARCPVLIVKASARMSPTYGASAFRAYACAAMSPTLLLLLLRCAASVSTRAQHLLSRPGGEGEGARARELNTALGLSVTWTRALRRLGHHQIRSRYEYAG